MDYQQHQQQQSRVGGGYNQVVRSPPTRQGNHHESPNGLTVNGNNNRMTLQRQHNNSDSSDLSGGMMVLSEVVSSSPSDMILQDQYGIIKEEDPNSDLYESSDNDKNNRKVSLNPDIQYWFEQKQKIDQLLIPLPSKIMSKSSLPTKNNDRNKSGQKQLQGRTNNNVLRIPLKNKATPQQRIKQITTIAGEKDFSESHFGKKIYDDGGKISAKELKEAFSTFQNKHFSDGVCKFVVRLFDLDRNGGLDIKEFEQLYSYIKLWVSAYHIYDRHHIGYLTEKDFHSALKHMDIHFSPEFILFLVTRCDPINRRVSLSQFIVTCVQIQKYTDEFKNRDDNYTGTIKLKYEDFLEMILRCL